MRIEIRGEKDESDYKLSGRKITAVIKQQFAIYSGNVFHKSVINLTHNDAALQTCNLNKIRQGKVWRDVFWS
jgi:hypothetical protein